MYICITNYDIGAGAEQVAEEEGRRAEGAEGARLYRACTTYYNILYYVILCYIMLFIFILYHIICYYATVY